MGGSFSGLKLLKLKIFDLKYFSTYLIISVEVTENWIVPITLDGNFIVV